MEKTELITVIIPVYLVEKYIKKCLDSVINQTYKNLEIILVDDGSPDNCGKICDEYAHKDERIKVIHKKNGGQSEARNFALDIAKGKYIAFVDSDDYIKDNMFETLYYTLVDNFADISICDIVKVKDGQKTKDISYGEMEILSRENAMKNLIREDYISNYIYNKLYKKELWDGIRFPIGKIMEDMDVMYKIIEKADKIVCTNQTEYYYLIRDNSSIAKIDKKVTENLKDVTNNRYKYLSEKNSDLLEILNVDKMMKIIQYHYNLSYCKEKHIYNSEPFLDEYKFYKENFKRYKEQIYYKQGKRKQFEMWMLYKNRKIYYHYSVIRNYIKNILRRK